MNKKTKDLLCIAAAVIALAAVIFFAVKYWDDITEFFKKVKEKTAKKASFTDEEYQDFADI